MPPRVTLHSGARLPVWVGVAWFGWLSSRRRSGRMGSLDRRLADREVPARRPTRRVGVEEEESAVIFGVDSHKSSLSICGINPLGRRVCAATFANSRARPPAAPGLRPPARGRGAGAGRDRGRRQVRVGVASVSWTPDHWGRCLRKGCSCRRPDRRTRPSSASRRCGCWRLVIARRTSWRASWGSQRRRSGTGAVRRRSILGRRARRQAGRSPVRSGRGCGSSSGRTGSCVRSGRS